MLRRLSRICLFVSSALSSSGVLGQPASADEAVVVTASRTEQRLRDAIPHTTVLTSRDIRDSQAPDLATLLRNEAGFEMAQNGGIGSTYSPLSLRGSTSARALVLVDGVRIEDAAFSLTALQHLMLDQVERVEIVRGNVSSLYGSNAVGGVIQVFTRRGAGAPGPNAQGMAGSRGTAKLQAGYGGAIGETRFNVSASRFRTAGFSAIDPAIVRAINPDRDGYRNESVSLSASHRLSGAHEAGFSFYRTNAHLEFDNVFFSRTDRNESGQRLQLAQAYWQAQFLEAWRARFTVAESTDHRRDTLNGAFFNRSNTRTRQFIWDNEVRVAPGHTLSLGYEERRQALDNDSVFGPNPLRRRNVDAWRFGYLGQIGRHTLQANARTERFSDVGSADTYLLGYGFDLTDAWRLTVSRSTAFRAPTFTDLDRVFGNPALRPERARTTEAGVQWARDAHRVRVVAFKTHFEDAIVLDRFFIAQNVGVARVEGVEGSYSGTLRGLDVRASLTVQDPVEQDVAGGIERQALGRAKAFGAVSAHRTFGAWRLGAEVRGSGERRFVDVNNGANRVLEPGYALVNLLARYNVNRNLFLAARLENVLDEDYRPVHGYNAAGRGVFLTVGWQP